MNLIETISTKIRHLPGLRLLSPLWDMLRPLYQKLVNLSAGTQGLPRMINGTDEVRVLPAWRALPEVYESQVWSRIMSQVRSGDCIVDIGAHFGLYAIAFAKRTGAGGCVLAVEADPVNAEVLLAHVRLNEVEGIVQVIAKALSDREGEAEWHSQDMQSVAKPAAVGSEAPKVEMTTLDRISDGRRVDVVLVDIEGYEESALRGGRELLSDPTRRPRLIVIEVHPYNWHLCGASSAGLLSFLHECGYKVSHLDGSQVVELSNYGHVLAEPA